MHLRELTLNLDDPGGATLTDRIYRAIVKAILDGRLKPGMVLPGSRNLAKDLGVTRNTTLAALDQLIAEGWLVSEPWRGVFVAPKPPMNDKVPMGASAPHQPGFDLPGEARDDSTGLDIINLATGLADSRLAPKEVLGRAYQRALKQHGDRLLGPGEPRGNLLLREMIASWVAERHGLAVGPEQVLLTSGGITGIHLLCEALLKPDDVVAVEEPGNRAVWEALSRGRRVELCPLAVDAKGVIPESLEQALRQKPIRMIYLTPRRQFPTTVVLDPERARRILDLAAEHRVAIYEDDTDAEIQYGDQRPLPLIARDTTGQVIFSASLSFLLAPGTRLGYLVVPTELAELLVRVRRSMEAQGDRVSEWAFADLIRDDEVARHLRRVRRIYEARRDYLCVLLQEEFAEQLEFEVPDGGLALWLRGRAGVDLDAWVRSALGAGLVLRRPAYFHLSPGPPCTRMGFSQVDEARLGQAVLRLKRAWAMANRT